MSKLKYRHTLTRDKPQDILGSAGGRATISWVMLNPSTADDKVDDPTIRRVKSFSWAAGYNKLHVLNLFPMRATNPKELSGKSLSELGIAHDANGQTTEHWWAQETAFACSDNVVVAWGAGIKHASVEAQGKAVGILKYVLRGTKFRDVLHLGLTKGGYPRHPLYVRGDTEFQVMDIDQIGGAS